MSKIKFLVLLLQIFGVTVFTSHSVAAQLMPGMVDMMPSMNTTMNNSINSARTRILSGGSGRTSGGSAAYNKQQALGAQKIKAGKASTLFSTTPAVTRELAQSLTWKDDKYKTVQQQVGYLNGLTAKFNKLLLENKLTVNDAVDGKMLAYAISSTIVNNKRPSAQHLTQLRQKFRNYMLNNAYYQGSSDASRQNYYELFAMCAMQALNNVEDMTTATSEAKKQTHKKDALANAEWVLKQIRELDAMM